MTLRIRSLLSAVLALAALALAATPAMADDEEVRVASYNIHHGADPNEQLDLQRIAGEIRATEADVIGLQEVDRHWGARSAFADQAAELGEMLGMEVAYGANLDLAPAGPGQPRRQYGTAILSEHRIVSSRNTLLPRPRNGEQRGLLEAVLDVDGSRFRFANTHLQHNNAEERAAQVQRIMELLAPAREPLALVGDLNARPEAPELAPLYGRYTDAWLEAGRGPGFTYSSTAPSARIDYVFTRGDVEVEEAEVRLTQASDHLPVVTELELDD